MTSRDFKFEIGGIWPSGPGKYDEYDAAADRESRSSLRGIREDRAALRTEVRERYVAFAG